MSTMTGIAQAEARPEARPPDDRLRALSRSLMARTDRPPSTFGLYLLRSRRPRGRTRPPRRGRGLRRGVRQHPGPHGRGVRPLRARQRLLLRAGPPRAPARRRPAADPAGTSGPEEPRRRRAGLGPAGRRAPGFHRVRLRGRTHLGHRHAGRVPGLPGRPGQPGPVPGRPAPAPGAGGVRAGDDPRRPGPPTRAEPPLPTLRAATRAWARPSTSTRRPACRSGPTSRAGGRGCSTRIRCSTRSSSRDVASKPAVSAPDWDAFWERCPARRAHLGSGSAAQGWTGDGDPLPGRSTGPPRAR